MHRTIQTIKKIYYGKMFPLRWGIVWGHWNGQWLQSERLGGVMLFSIEISFSFFSIEHIYVISKTFTDRKNEVVQIFGKKVFFSFM